MSKSKIILNSDGVRDLLLSDEIAALCREKAAAACGRCGAGYQSDVYYGKKRVNAMIWAESSAAKKDNLENNTILKALK